MSSKGDARVARLVELARERVRDKLGDRPDPVPVWAYRAIVRVVLVELRREEN